MSLERGRIVKVGSIRSELTFPRGGFYHSTNYVLEARTDALRFEVVSLGIAAMPIEPGLIVSR